MRRNRNQTRRRDRTSKNGWHTRLTGLANRMKWKMLELLRTGESQTPGTDVPGLLGYFAQTSPL